MSRANQAQKGHARQKEQRVQRPCGRTGRRQYRPSGERWPQGQGGVPKVREEVSPKVREEVSPKVREEVSPRSEGRCPQGQGGGVPKVRKEVSPRSGRRCPQGQRGGGSKVREEVSPRSGEVAPRSGRRCPQGQGGGAPRSGRRWPHTLGAPSQHHRPRKTLPNTQMGAPGPLTSIVRTCDLCGRSSWLIGKHPPLVSQTP